MKKKSEDLPTVLKVQVRYNIYEMVKEKQYVTLDSLLVRLQDKYIYDVGRDSLHKLVFSFGN